MQTRYCTVCTLRVAAVFRRDNPTAFAMGFSFFYSAEFIRWPSTFGTPEGQLEQPQASGTREAPLERPQGSCGPCIVCWQEILSPSYYPLERPKGYWNARSATGTEPLALPGTPAGLLEQSRRLYLERAKRSWNHPTGLRAL